VNAFGSRDVRGFEREEEVLDDADPAVEVEVEVEA
jgi:hypothetical protein